MADSQLPKEFLSKRAEFDAFMVHGDLRNAHRILKDMFQAFSPGDGLSPNELSAINNSLKQLRSRLSKETSLKAQQQLAEIESMIINKDFDDFEKAIAKLDEIEDPGSSERIEELRALITEKSNNHRAHRVYLEIKQECEHLWRREQDLLKQKVTADRILNEIFDAALQKTRQAVIQFPKSLQLDGLRNDAQIRYDLARQRYEIKTTADQTGQYKKAKEDLEKIQDKETLIPWNDTNGRPLPPITVRNAILEIAKLAGDFAHTKVQQYMRDAQKALHQHAPRSASDEINKGRDLWGLPVDDRNELEKYYKERIKPEIERLERAEHLIEQGRTASDLEQGWASIDQASAEYPWTPGIDHARKELCGRILHRVDVVVQDAGSYCETFLKGKNLALEMAEKEISDAAMLLGIIRVYIDSSSVQDLESHLLICSSRIQELIQEIKIDQGFVKAVRDEILVLEELIDSNLSKAQKGWDALVSKYNDDDHIKRYGNLFDRFSELTSLRSRIDALLDFDRSLDDLEADFESNEIERLRQASENCSSILKGVKDPSNRRRIKNIQDKISSRLEFLDCLVSFEQTGDIEDVIARLKTIVQLTFHPDKHAAEEKIKEFLNARHEEELVDSAIKNARSLLKMKPRLAYEALKKVSNFPSKRKKEVNSLLEIAQNNWRTDVVGQMLGLVTSKSTDSKKLESLVQEAQNELPPLRPEEEIRIALAYLRSLEAQIHAKAGRWKKAEQSWQAALQHDALNADYEIGWRQARLHRAEVDLHRAKSEQDIFSILETLQDEIPNDAGVWELRARYIYKLSQDLSLTADARLVHIAQAQNDLRSAEMAVELNLTSISGLHDKIRELKIQIAADETLLKTQRDIERRMSSESSLSQLSGAVRDVSGLLEQSIISPSAKEGLATWWSAFVPRVLENLEKQDGNLTDDNLWERFEVRSKIALLLPEHPLARLLVRTLPMQVDTLTDLIHSAVSDRLGHVGQEKDSGTILAVQQQHSFQLRERAQMLHEMVQRLSAQLGTEEASRLSGELQESLLVLQPWIRRFEDFRQNLLSLLVYLSQAQQDNDWRDFDQVLSDINSQGFGNHRAIRAIIDQRDTAVEKRKALAGLCQRIAESAENPNGLYFRQAIALLHILQDDESSGDPSDAFGFQSELTITDPFTQKQVHQAVQILNWLEERELQLVAMVDWLVRSGLAELLPADLSDYFDPTSAKRILPWEQLKPKIVALMLRGNFGAVRQKLKSALTLTDNQLQANSSRVKTDADVDGLLQTYVDMLRIQDAFQQLDVPPFPRVKALSRSVAELFDQAIHFKARLQNNLNEINALINDAPLKQQAWNDAENELEQALRELNATHQQIIPFGKAKRVEAAETRVQRAIQQCKAIAPNHPDLDDIDRLLSNKESNG